MKKVLFILLMIMLSSSTRFGQMYPQTGEQISPDSLINFNNGKNKVHSFSKGTKVVGKLYLPEKEEKRFTVSGYVRTIANLPVPEFTVQAFDKMVGRKPVLLGKTKTNKDGIYQIDYIKQVEKVIEDEQIDLFIQCYDNKGNTQDKSDLLINAPQNAIINLTVSKKRIP